MSGPPSSSDLSSIHSEACFPQAALPSHRKLLLRPGGCTQLGVRVVLPASPGKLSLAALGCLAPWSSLSADSEMPMCLCQLTEAVSSFSSLTWNDQG